MKRGSLNYYGGQRKLSRILKCAALDKKIHFGGFEKCSAVYHIEQNYVRLKFNGIKIFYLFRKNKLICHLSCIFDSKPSRNLIYLKISAKTKCFYYFITL